MLAVTGHGRGAAAALPSATVISDGGRLERRLGLGDAVVIGAGSMIGAGVFAAWAPAAGAAGTGC
jgi:UDP-3-O-[3-hydroxymyristoyl] glucosamine N-acyltransferase